MRKATGSVAIRRLTPADAAAFREIRLEALARYPEAFSSAFETESVEPVRWFAERLRQSDTFGAFRGDKLVGIGSFFIQQGPKRQHKGVLAGVYVRREAQRLGIGRRLMETLIDRAKGRVELLHLTVTSTNEVARLLYQSLGFAEYGIEKNALKLDGRYYDDVLMAKPLVGR